MNRWQAAYRAAIEAAAVRTITDPDSSQLDIAAAQRAMVHMANWSRLTDGELRLLERLHNRLDGTSDTPVVLDRVETSIVAPRARCERCERYTDQDLVDLDQALADDGQDDPT